MKHSRKQRATAMVMAVVFLTIFAAIAIACAAAANTSMHQAGNLSSVHKALLQAESGMDFMIEQLAQVRLPLTTTEETLPADLAQALGQTLNATANLGGQTITVVGSQVVVPEIELPHGSFCCTLSPAGEGRCSLVVHGRHQGVWRTIGIDFLLVAKQSPVFDYGLVSFGPLSVTGGAKVVGVNDPSEANVLAASDASVAVTLEGNALISGDITLAGDSTAAISGTPSLGGTTDPAEMVNHIHTLATTPDVPEINAAPFAAMTTSVIDASTDTSTTDLTFNNIRIAANSNPTFPSDVVLNGVVYVEAPNIVTFEGNTTINGVIVTEQNTEPFESCKLDFSGQVEACGVEALPDTAEFADIKQHTGTFLLAPGFGVTFSGQFSAISGTIAADQLTFTGQSEGIVNGAVVGLTDRQMSLDGNVEIHVDRTSQYPDPAGFVKTLAFVAEPGSYSEAGGG